MPRQGLFTTCYSLQHPDWPPFPGNVNGNPACNCGEFHLLDDRHFDYDAPPFSRTARRSLGLNGLTPLPGDGDGGDDGTNLLESSFLARAAFTGYPTTLLGTNYCILARRSFAGGASQLAIVATADDTTVTITPSASANLHGSLWTNSFVLQAGQTYQNESSDDTGDVTGTLIKADKPIAVFAGASLACVPDVNTASGNPLVQEQLPVNTWGKQALALSFAGRFNGDSYRVLAAFTNTVVTIKGKVVTVDESTSPWTVTTSNKVVVVTNQAGQFYDIIVDGPVEF